jgi:hypothetical protein
MCRSFSFWSFAVALALFCQTASTSSAEEAQPMKPTARVGRVHPARAGLGERITIEAENWNPTNATQAASWVLFLDGIPIKGLHSINKDFHDGRFTFQLQRDEKNAESWAPLLNEWKWKKTLSVGIGPENGVERPVAPLDDGLEFEIFPHNPLVLVWIGLVLALTVGLVRLGARSNLLRDPQVAGETPPFSLGRVQFAWWLCIILCSYLSIGMATWDYYTTLSSSALMLLGISTGAALGGAVIDAAGLNQGQNSADTSDATANSLKRQLASPTLTDDERAKLQRALADLQSTVAARTAAPTSVGFFRDILSDGTSISIHRLQNLAWTVVLGVVFIVAAWKEKRMPDFNTNMLLLMGISSGTYLAFKASVAPEKRG